MKHIRHILIGAVCLLSMAASAQWQWVDTAGRKVFSDRAPPIDVPEKNILKRPGIRGTTANVSNASTDASVAGAGAPASAPQGVASEPKLSGVDQALLDKKKKAEQAQAAQRKAQEENLLKAKVESCARAKQAKATLDSGMRLAQINEKGQREILDQAQRAAEAKRIESIIEADCQ